MENKKLQQLAEDSTSRVESNNYMYYWQCDNYKFDNRSLSKWYELATGKWSTFIFSKYDKVKKVLSDGLLDMNRDYQAEYVAQLRDQYDYIQLFFSGGYDSNTVLDQFVQQGIVVDETLSLIVGRSIDQPGNQEIKNLALPALSKYSKYIKKQTILKNDYQTLTDWFKDEYRFFVMPGDSVVPYGLGRLGNTVQHREVLPNSCYIKCHDKPQLVYYKNRWYAYCLDVTINGDTDIPNMLWFWYEPDNIKSYIQQSRKYRDYILQSTKVESKLGFYKTDQDRYINTHVLGRTPIVDETKMLRKDISGKKLMSKHVQRMQDIIADGEYQLLTNYFACQKIYNQIFDANQSQHVLDGNANSKFAWFIDIDSLEMFTQNELIPDGFDPSW